MRASGVLMHLSSLPSPYGIGTMGRAAREFVDFLAAAGQRYWQILPICPTSYGDSPYQSFSTFAGNPYLIDLDLLAADGLLRREEYADIDWESTPDRVNYGALYRKRWEVLRKACGRLLQAPPAAYADFCAENAFWLPDYALFMALKDEHGGCAWTQWEPALRRRDPAALDAARTRCAGAIGFWQAVQYLFFAQWRALKHYANQKGVFIIGDLPIYVAADSVDVWSAPEAFQLGEDLLPTEVAGCPPDGFSATGQLWGNPLYNWDAMAQNGYAWWVRRIRVLCSTYDVLRIDHFRGLESYYAIPYGDTTARNGRWRKGPGMDFIRAINQNVENAAIIAEDLGFLTPAVKRLLKNSGYPGMKVLQFAFDPNEDSSYLPHYYPHNCVVYTGTHDNTTTRGWLDTQEPEVLQLAKDYLGFEAVEDGPWAFIRGALESVADLAVIPLQDYLGLGGECRINTPSTVGGTNWRWRMSPEDMDEELAGKMARLSLIYGRASKSEPGKGPAEEPAQKTGKSQTAKPGKKAGKAAKKGDKSHADA